MSFVSIKRKGVSKPAGFETPSLCLVKLLVKLVINVFMLWHPVVSRDLWLG